MTKRWYVCNSLAAGVFLTEGARIRFLRAIGVYDAGTFVGIDAQAFHPKTHKVRFDHALDFTMLCDPNSLEVEGGDMPEKVQGFVKYENAKCSFASARAICVEVAGTTVWIPKSQIHDDSETYDKNTDGTLIISRWIARERELEDAGEEYGA